MRIRPVLVLGTAAACVIMSVSAGYSAETALSNSEHLGKSLFFDENLSLNKNQSCATCHGPMAGWTGPDTAINEAGSVYEGSVPGRFGNRKPPSAGYATQSPILSLQKAGFVGGNFWDGRATGETLGSPTAEQAKGPFLNPVEQAMPDSACVVYRACTATYGGQLPAVWGPSACMISWPTDADATCAAGTGIRDQLTAADQLQVDATYDNIARSIAAYEGSPEVNAFSSKYDLARGNKAVLTAQERVGMALFKGKAKCATCHSLNGSKPLLTDYTYDNLGVPKNPANPVYDTDPTFIDPGLGGFLDTRPDYKQYAAENWGKQKVPTLRNVALGDDTIVKAYMHNGYFKTLEGIVHFYNTRDTLPRCPGDYTEAEALAAHCWPAPEVSANLNTEVGNLGLTHGEELALTAFLRTLSDGYTR